HDLRASDDAGERKSAGERFRYGDEVGLDAGMLDSEHPPGASEPGLYLVGDQRDPVLVADAAKRGQQLGWRRMKSPLALDGLDDDRGDVDWIDVGAEEIVDGLERVGH